MIKEKMETEIAKIVEIGLKKGSINEEDVMFRLLKYEASAEEIEKVLYICGEDANNIQIEGIELNESAPIRKGRGKAQEEDFLAD